MSKRRSISQDGAMEPEIAGALAGAVAGTGAAALTRFVFDRRAEHSHARSIARLLHRQLDDIRIHIERAIDQQEPWMGSDFAVPVWADHAHEIAGELDDSELLVLSSVMNWIAAANAWRAEFLAASRSRFGRPRRMFGPEDERLLKVVSGTVQLACQSVGPLRKGRRWFVFRRRVPRSLAPSLGGVCVCGHAFGQHDWWTKRRWLRLRHPRASHHDVAGRCKECECEKFQRPETSRLKLFLRHSRLLPQAPES